MPCSLVTSTGTILTCIIVCFIFFGRDYKNVCTARSFLHGYSFLAVEIVLRPIMCRYISMFIPFQSVAQIIMIIIIVSILISYYTYDMLLLFICLLPRLYFRVHTYYLCWKTKKHVFVDRLAYTCFINILCKL